MYGNQGEIGNALAKLMKEGIVKREDVWITSKACGPCQHLSQAAQGCLELTIVPQGCVSPMLSQAAMGCVDELLDQEADCAHKGLCCGSKRKCRQPCPLCWH